MKICNQKQKMVKSIGLNNEVANWLFDLNPKYCIWFAKQLQQEKNLTITNLEQLRESFKYIIDWVVGSQLRGKHIVLKQYTLETALRNSITWHKDIENEINDKITIDDEDGKILIQFPDGYYWIDLQTNESKSEAKAMQHCGIAGEYNTLLSLRRNKKPCITCEISEDYSSIYQIKGKQNKKPHEKYHKYIIALIEKHNTSLEGGRINDFCLLDLCENELKRLAKKSQFKERIIQDAILKNYTYEKISHIIPGLNKINYINNYLLLSPVVHNSFKIPKTPNEKYNIKITSWPKNNSTSGFNFKILEEINVEKLEFLSSYHKPLILINDDLKCDEFSYPGGNILVNKKCILPPTITCNSLEFSKLNSSSTLKNLYGILEISNCSKFETKNLSVSKKVYYDKSILISDIKNIDCSKFISGINLESQLVKRNCVTNDVCIKRNTIYAEDIEINEISKDILLDNNELKYNVVCTNVYINCDFKGFDKINAETVFLQEPGDEFAQPNLLIDFSYLNTHTLSIGTEIKDTDTLKNIIIKNLHVTAPIKNAPENVTKITIECEGHINNVSNCKAKYWNFHYYQHDTLPLNMPNNITSINITGSWHYGGLKTLRGCPQNIKTNFYCTNTELENLEGLPKTVGKNINLKNALSSGKTSIKSIEQLCKVGGTIKADVLSDDNIITEITSEQIKRFTSLGLKQKITVRLDKNKTYRFDDLQTHKFYTVNAITGNAYWQHNTYNDQNKVICKDTYDLRLQINDVINVIERHRKI